jgi:hypothetical protein
MTSFIIWLAFVNVILIIMVWLKKKIVEYMLAPNRTDSEERIGAMAQLAAVGVVFIALSTAYYGAMAVAWLLPWVMLLF